MNESNDATNQVQAALETASLDSGGQHLVVMMLGITACTAAVGTGRPRDPRGHRCSHRHERCGRVLTELGGRQAHRTEAREANRLAPEACFPSLDGIFSYVRAVHRGHSILLERGLAWESYMLLLSSACGWMVVQALVINGVSPGAW